MKLKKLIAQNTDELNIRVTVVPDQEERFGRIHMISDFTAQLQVGDRVVFGKNSGIELAIPGERCYTLLRLADIYGVIDENEMDEAIHFLKHGR